MARKLSEPSHDATARGALADVGICCDIEPEKLSRDLWGYFNLCLAGSEKVAIDNVESGNGFDAWRRVAVPIGPRSEAQLSCMHKEVHSPRASRRLADVVVDLDQWESKCNKYYRGHGRNRHLGHDHVDAQ